MAVEIAHAGKRIIYTSDTGPHWSPLVFAPGADLLLSEATYQHDDIRAPIHLSARQAGELARAADAKRLVITHLWPTLDPVASVAEASDAYGAPVMLAAPHLVTHV
jgi:ribonuclease BN (tRNA processing enzyme)